MKICVITPRYALAGVPLAQARFAKALSNRGYDVDFIIGFVESNYERPIIDGVNVHVWNNKKTYKMLPSIIRYLFKARPEIIFSAEDHLNVIVILAAIFSRSSVKISGSSRVTPFDTYSSTLFTKRWVLKHIMRLVMWRANALTCVSKDMVGQYRDVFKNPPHVYAYNIVVDNDSRSRMCADLKDEWFKKDGVPVIIAAGRLAPWKGFENLIQAINIVTSERKVRLIILGGGPLHKELQNKIDILGLGDTVALKGYVKNPLKYFFHSDIFVLSSLVEGMPNVLIEAMMCGCTPVSTDCPTGPKEILQNGKFGYLVPVGDELSMAKGILKALDNPISSYTLDKAIESFEESAVIDRHFELLGMNCNDL